MSRLSGGNMSKVYLCIDFDSEEKEEVIIKTFEISDADNKDLHKALFHREVENLEKLDNELIIKIKDKGTDFESNINFIVLDYFESKSLEQVIYKELFNERQKDLIILNILDALVYAHSKGVVHRDIKPSNILINDSNHIKIIDFGISKIKDSLFSDYTVCNFGTPKYASWEQKVLKPIDFRTDIYSVGVVITELLLSKEISLEEDIHNTIVTSDIRNEFKDLLIKMTGEKPEDRFSSISEVKNIFKMLINKDTSKKVYGISFANTVIKKLHLNGYIQNETRFEAKNIIHSDLSNEDIFIENDRNNLREDQQYYKVYGKQFEYKCVIDQKTESTFTIIQIWFRNAATHITNKERAVSLEAEFEVCERMFTSEGFENINDLISDFEVDYRIQRLKSNKEKNEKNSIQRWNYVLNLFADQLEENKNTHQYVGLEKDATGERIIVELKNKELEKVFTDDQLLCMTSASNIHRIKVAGYCIDSEEGKLVIQLSKDASPDDFANSGEISIDKRMVEISLNRQKKALKSVQFKEMHNPKLADILLNPEIAESSTLIKDIKFKSNLDDSKKDAVEKALQAKDIFLLQGPPGTGKTTFISELVTQIITEDSGAKILISSQSNVAVDHAMNKIKSMLPGIKMLRVGRKDKLSLGAEQFTIDEQLDEFISSIKQNCLYYIQELRNKINLNPEVADKYEKLVELEKLKNRVANLDENLFNIQMNLDSINLKYTELKNLSEDLQKFSAKINGNLNIVSEFELKEIVNTFKNEFLSVGETFIKKLDVTNEISDQKSDLEAKLIQLMYEKEELSSNIIERNELLEINSPADFYNIKSSLVSQMENNRKTYERISKVESIQNEWISRIGTDEKLLDVLIKKMSIIGATCLGISSLPYTGEIDFDWVIIDEAGRATAPELLVPITLGRKIVLVGDHKQLPPIIDQTIQEMDLKKQDITIKDLEMSLFEELLSSITPNCIGILKEQYRMHPGIGNLVSKVFYDGQLESMTTESDRNHGYSKWDSKGVVWLSTAKNASKKEQIINNRSHKTYQNNLEVEVIFNTLMDMEREFAEKNIKKDIGIIAGYQAQKSLIRKVYETEYKDRFRFINIEINTVDAFQGRETDVIFYSIVRSNDEGKIGFLSDARRLNVALSRAKELLVIIGDHMSATQEQRLPDGKNNPFGEVLEFMRLNDKHCSFEEV